MNQRRKLIFKALTEDIVSIVVGFTDLVTSISLLVCLGMFDYAEHLLEEGLGRVSKGSYVQELGVNPPILVDQIAALAETGGKYVRLVRWIIRIIGCSHTITVAQKTVGLVTAEEFNLLFPTVVKEFLIGRSPVCYCNAFYGVSPSSRVINNVLSIMCRGGDTRRVGKIIERMNEMKINVESQIFTTYGGVYEGGKGTSILIDVWRLVDERGKINLSKTVISNSDVDSSLRMVLLKDLARISGFE